MGLSGLIPDAIRTNTFANALVRAVRHAAAENLSFIAGGVAFFGFLSIFPAIAAAVMVWGRFAEPEAIGTRLQPLSRAMPDSAFEVIRDQLVAIASSSPANLTFGALVALLLAFWSAAKGARALIAAMNISYAESESRGFIQSNLLALAFTLGGIVYGLISLALMGVLPALLAAIQLGAWATVAIEAGRWLLAVLLFSSGLCLVYRFAPDRAPVHWRWILPGAVLATGLWMAASWAFSLYVSNIADFNATFGALGSVAVLMFWMWISAFIVCFGAVVNAELEPRERGEAMVT